MHVVGKLYNRYLLDTKIFTVICSLSFYANVIVAASKLLVRLSNVSKIEQLVHSKSQSLTSLTFN